MQFANCRICDIILYLVVRFHFFRNHTKGKARIIFISLNSIEFFRIFIKNFFYVFQIHFGRFQRSLENFDIFPQIAIRTMKRHWPIYKFLSFMF